MNNTNYPPYYHSVFVKYRIKGTNIIKTQKMWLAVNDRGKYIWTNACNNIHVWTDEEIEVINWWNCSTQSSDGIDGKPMDNYVVNELLGL